MESTMRRHFPVAPSPRTLEAISALGTALLVVAGITAYRTIPAASGFTHSLGLAIALVFPAILIGSLMFMLNELRRAWLDSQITTIEEEQALLNRLIADDQN